MALLVRDPTPTTEQLMFGGASIGCLYKDCTPEQAQACIDRSLQHGVTYFDTAPWYGAGLSETRLGQGLVGKDVKISTKAGRVIKPKNAIDPAVDHPEQGYDGHFFTDAYHMNRPCWTYTGEGVRESVRQSCERLQRDVLDCLRLHDAETEERFAQATAPGGAIDTMIALKKEGKVKEISLGMNDHTFVTRFVKQYPNTFDNIMLAGCFNLIDHDSIELLLECQAQGIKITNVGVFASGVLWGGDNYKYGNIPAHVRTKVEGWEALAKKHGFSLPQVAFNFAFLPAIVEFSAFGTSRVDAVDQNVALCGVSIPLELWREAQAAGLMSREIPLPAASSAL